jgi:hypothetical protein
MENTLEKKSSIWLLKSKFFLIRVLTYFSFLLLPVWLPKSLSLNLGLQTIILTLYILFMCSQWFFLGKEIDHRMKIYFRVNSSMDRVVYRLYLGMFFFILYFNLLWLLPHKWVYNSFWITWVSLGLFYSWPTRGKIIKESVTSNFTEFRYLDSFERTLVLLIIVLLIFSTPGIPEFENVEALKLFFDPQERLNSIMWNFLTVNYYPFYKYPELLKIAWSMHFYAVWIGLFFLTFYALLRFFVSRRLSLLGVFSLVSSWSLSKILSQDFGITISTTYSLLWVWSLLWVTKSSTYRVGLFLGLVGYFGVLINQQWFFLGIIQITLLYFWLINDKTPWFKRQLLRYASFGLGLTLLTVFSLNESLTFFNFNFENYSSHLMTIFKRKAFFSLAPLGLILSLAYLLKTKTKNRFKSFPNLKVERDNIIKLIISILILSVYGLIFDIELIEGFTIMWVLAIFSLFPIELVFQTISRLRSSRNMIYLIYILICLLDSHFEGRVKIFLRLFER